MCGDWMLSIVQQSLTYKIIDRRVRWWKCRKKKKKEQRGSQARAITIQVAYQKSYSNDQTNVQTYIKNYSVDSNNDEVMPRTSKKKKTQAQVRIDSSASDRYANEHQRATEIKNPKVKQSSSEQSESSSGISSTPLIYDQSQLVLPTSIVFEESTSSSRDLSKTLTRWRQQMRSCTPNKQSTINQSSSAQVNQAQSTCQTGKIPARKTLTLD